MPEVASPITLDQVELVAVRMSHPIQPPVIPEPDALDHERIRLPSAHRIPHERGVRISRQWSSVHEDLPVCRVLFVQQDDEARHLHEFEGTRERIDAWHADRHTVRLWRILSLILQPLFEERISRRTQRHLVGLEIPGDVREVPWEDLVLDTLWLAPRVGFRPPD